MEQSLRAYLSGKLPPSNLTVDYHIGSAFQGETDFHLSGDGSYRLWSTVTQGRQRREYTGQVNTSDVEDLIRTMLSARLWEVKHVTKKQGRDNPEARIVVSDGDQSFPIVLWVSETEDVSAFHDVQEKILALVRSVSKGEVLEVGR